MSVSLVQCGAMQFELDSILRLLAQQPADLEAVAVCALRIDKHASGERSGLMELGTPRCCVVGSTSVLTRLLGRSLVAFTRDYIDSSGSHAERILPWMRETIRSMPKALEPGERLDSRGLDPETRQNRVATGFCEGLRSLACRGQLSALLVLSSVGQDDRFSYVGSGRNLSVAHVWMVGLGIQAEQLKPEEVDAVIDEAWQSGFRRGPQFSPRGATC